MALLDIQISWSAVGVIVAAFGILQVGPVALLRYYILSSQQSLEKTILQYIELKYVPKVTFDIQYNELIHRYNNLSQRHNFMQWDFARAITRIEIRVGLLPSDFKLPSQEEIDKGKVF